uniref:Uncharacterized protein n=1 Tax=Plectus sambesii TaxID=2011161 RepID=A0A914WUL0_9BILA
MTSQISLYSADQSKWTEQKQARDHSFSLLTVIYALFITVFSLSLELWIQERPELDDLRLIFNASMLSVGLAVMVYFYAILLHPGWLRRIADWLGNTRIKEMTHATRATHSSNGAASLYLRLGAVAFGIVAVFYCGLKIYVRIHRKSCKTSDILGNVLQALFFFAQMHFIFCNSQMTIVRSCRLAKLGAMHLVAVNLWTWFRLFLEKQKSADKHTTSDDRNDNGTNATQESLYLDTKVLMSTCAVEYSLIGAAIMLVLWMNIGRVDIGHLTLLNHRRKQQMRIDCSASSTGLFVGLIFVLVTVVDMVITDGRAHVASSFVSWSIHEGLLVFVLLACVACMWRMRRLSYAGGHRGAVEMLDEILLIIGLVGELVFCSIMLLDFFPTTQPTLIPNFSTRDQLMLFTFNVIRLVQVLLQSLLILFCTKLVATGRNLEDKPGKQFVTFLLVANVALFVLHTYETQRGTVDGVSFHGSGSNLVVLKAVNPLVIFFRFHSSVCLAHLWKHAYTAKGMASRDRSVTDFVLPSRQINSSRIIYIRERASSVTVW